MKKRLLAALLGACLCLSGCQVVEQTATQIFAMDTFMTLSVHHRGGKARVEELLSRETARIYELESLLSVTREGSDIHTVNASGGKPVTLSPETASLLEDVLELCERTDGALDITAYPAVKAWGFTTGENRVPEAGELEELKGIIDYRQVRLEGNTVTLPPHMELDLGAVAKGYLGQTLGEAFARAELSACLTLGGNIQTVGEKAEGGPWRVGIQDPRGTDPLGVVSVTDRAVVTSGNYQRFFEEEGRIYGHILDPETAAPAQTGLESVTVVASSGLLADGLSTALFVMGLEEARAHWETYGDFEAVFIDEAGDVYITAGLKGNFELTRDYAHREVTVFE